MPWCGGASDQIMQEKRPRQYFQEMSTLRTREERAAFLQSVPDHLRDMVKTHFLNWWNREIEKRNRDKRPQ